jgi:hypothetical protein
MSYHEHHCNACLYLGYEGPRTVEEKSGGGYVDLYIHTGWRAGIGTFTRRWGMGNKYVEIPIAKAEGPRWETVRAVAFKKGALKP